MMKRMMSLLVALCMIFGMVPAAAFALEPAQSIGLNRIDIPVQVNPLYADVEDGTNLRVSAHGGDYAAQAEAEKEYLPADQVVPKIRENLKNRVEEFTVYVRVDQVMDTQEQIQALFLDMFEAALAHTGDPVEGDYLRWQYGEIGGGVLPIKYGDITWLDVTYTVAYYTTSAQEEAVDAKVDNLLQQLDLEDLCDYEKVCGIYDYLIENVTYDHDNLNNNEYKLKHTAYAALMDGTAVCQGYALLFYRLALELGVDARLVPGSTNGGAVPNHAWNIVELNGLYYNLDSTYDAEIGQRQWFLMGTPNFTKHTPDYDYVEEGFYSAYPMSPEDFAHSATAVVTEPGCTTGGYTTYTCVCGDTYMADETPATGHTEVIDKAVDATCTEDGLTEGSHCAVCNEILVAQEVIKSEGHHHHGVVTDPTCTKEGYTTFTCACGHSYVDNQVPALGHKEVVDAAVAPSCTEGGLTEGKHCSVCGETLVAQKPVEPTGHLWDEGTVTKEPTETETGICVYACTACDATREEVMPVLEHKHVHRAVVTAPTCTEKGYTTYTCACGDTYVDDEVPARGHTEEIVAAVAPTCTEDGLTEGKRCSVCRLILVQQEPVKATGHNWDEGTVTKEPTETETGIRTYSCTACDATREEEIPTLEHKHVHKSVVTAPTCTEKGYTTYTCACGDTYVDDEVPALGHTEVIDAAVAPTCTEDGLTEGKHCSVCGEVLAAQKVVQATGHHYEDGTCTVCGEKAPEETDPTDPSEPEETDPTDPSEPEETDPTDPSEPEETDPTDPSEPEETDPTTPSEPEEHTHEYGAWVTVKDPTSTAEGAEERLCACGKSELRVIPKLTNPFSDVKESNYFYESVLWAAHKGITSGVSATQFAPNQVCTRAQVVTFLWRAAGEPEPVSGKNPFTDVNSSAYYYKAVLWAVEQGITSGISKTQFAPNQPCTRAQVVTFLWRAQDEPKVEKAENTFTDVNAAAYYHQAVLWAVENNITSGVGNGKFAPDNHCTRGQIVTFLYRAFAKV